MVNQHLQTPQSQSAKMATDEFQMKLDPDCIDVAPVSRLPEINIVSRQTIFFKDKQGWFIPEKASRPAIVNTGGESLRDLRVVWHMPNRRENPLPEMVANILDLNDALINLDVLDSQKIENHGNSCDITPSTLLPGESTPISVLSSALRC